MYKIGVKLKIEKCGSWKHLLVGVNYPNGWGNYEYTKYYFRKTSYSSITEAILKFHHKEILEVLNDMGKLREFVKVLIRSHLEKVNNGLKINKIHEKISELNKMGIEFSFDDKELK